MKNFKKKYFITLSALVDFTLLIVSFLIARNVIFKEDFPENNYFIQPLVGLSLIWFIICIVLDLYDNSKKLYTHIVLSKNSFGLFVFLIASAGFVFLITEYKFSRAFLVLFITIYSLFILTWRCIVFFIEKKLRIEGSFVTKVIILGTDNKTDELISKVYNNPLFGFQLKAIFSNDNFTANINDPNIVLGNLEKTHNYLLKNKVDLILIVLNYQHIEFTKQILNFADNNLIRVHIIPEFSDYFSMRFSINYYNRIPVLNLRNEPLKKLSNMMIKRAMDIFFSLLTIIFAFPVFFPIIIIAIKLTSKGPIFFIQKRTGLEGKIFNCYKFRTMEVNEGSDSVQTVKNDKRITRVGKFLRKTSIDEFPQVFNILKNQMSYVGPRPHMLKHTEHYREQVNRFMVRHYAKPGLTGWAQINGFRGETKELIDMEKRAEADIWYVENWSFFLDLKIIYETIYMVLFKKENKAY